MISDIVDDGHIIILLFERVTDIIVPSHQERLFAICP